MTVCRPGPQKPHDLQPLLLSKLTYYDLCSIQLTKVCRQSKRSGHRLAVSGETGRFSLAFYPSAAHLLHHGSEADRAHSRCSSGLAADSPGTSGVYSSSRMRRSRVTLLFRRRLRAENSQDAILSQAQQHRRATNSRCCRNTRLRITKQLVFKYILTSNP